MLGVSRSWLYEAAKCGRIPCIRLGDNEGPLRFRLEELEAWVARSRVSAREVSDGPGHQEGAGHSHRHAAPVPPIRADLAQLRLIPPGGY